MRVAGARGVRVCGRPAARVMVVMRYYEIVLYCSFAIIMDFGTGDVPANARDFC